MSMSGGITGTGHTSMAIAGLYNPLLESQIPTQNRKQESLQKYETGYVILNP